MEGTEGYSAYYEVKEITEDEFASFWKQILKMFPDKAFNLRYQDELFFCFLLCKLLVPAFSKSGRSCLTD